MNARALATIALALTCCAKTTATTDAGDAAIAERDAADESSSPASDGATADAGNVVTYTRGAATQSDRCPANRACAAGVVAPDRVTTCGTITLDGQRIEVPAPITDGASAEDLYDTCTRQGVVSDYESRLPTVVVDPDGELVTGYLFADNYFELFVNGQFIAKDSLGFTPFNASVVRFRARYPMTIAVSLVDWEGVLGVGVESRNGAAHIGDGGFIAVFSNQTSTDAQWRCRPMYVAPLDDPSCLAIDRDGITDSSACPSTDNAVRCVSNQPERSCLAAHGAIPSGWAAPGFDDSRWPAATIYDAARVTIDPAYTSFANTLLASGRFIWSRNLDLDNHVLCRRTVVR